MRKLWRTLRPFLGFFCPLAKYFQWIRSCHSVQRWRKFASLTPPWLKAANQLIMRYWFGISFRSKVDLLKWDLVVSWCIYSLICTQSTIVNFATAIAQLMDRLVEVRELKKERYPLLTRSGNPRLEMQRYILVTRWNFVTVIAGLSMPKKMKDNRKPKGRAFGTKGTEKSGIGRDNTNNTSSASNTLEYRNGINLRKRLQTELNYLQRSNYKKS